MANLTKSSLLDLVKTTQRQVKNGKPYSLFGIGRGIFLPVPREFGHYNYSRNRELEKKFDRHIADNEFRNFGYVDYIAGPVKPIKSCGFLSWENEIEHAIRMKEPENLVYYVRQDNQLASRVLIPIADFYGGLTDEEAIKKYGKTIFKKMAKHLTGVTVSRDSDGEIRLPFGDLNYAYKKVMGMKTLAGEWD